PRAALPEWERVSVLGHNDQSAGVPVCDPAVVKTDTRVIGVFPTQSLEQFCRFRPTRFQRAECRPVCLEPIGVPALRIYWFEHLGRVLPALDDKRPDRSETVTTRQLHNFP